MSEFAREYLCPVSLTLDVVGGKWKPLILWALREGPCQFNALHAGLPGITAKVLTQQLRGLESDAIVARTVREGGVRTVEYALTEFGGTLSPVLNVMAAWAKDHHERIGATIGPAAEHAQRRLAPARST